MSEWLKVEHNHHEDAYGGSDYDTTLIRADLIASLDVLGGGDVLVVNFVGDDDISTTFRNVKSARFVNTEEDKPSNYFVSRSCGGCE